MTHAEPAQGAPHSSARIADELARRINTGELDAGDTVPSTRQITREFGVAMATATRALAALQQQGLVHVVSGVGTVVGAAPSADPASKEPASTLPTSPGGSDQPLTRDGIVLAAVTIADTEGIAALSMRRVATALDTATMSLYRHVRNKDQLLALMADRVFMDYPLPAAGGNWRPSLEALCRLQWSAYQSHPWLAQYMSMTRPQLIPRGMAHTEMAMSVLGRTGLDLGERLHAAVMLANYVRGTGVSLEPEALAEQDTGMTNDEWMEAQSALMGQILATGRFPAFTEVLSGGEVELDLNSVFEFGLHRLLDGLEVLVKQRSRAQKPANPRSRS